MHAEMVPLVERLVVAVENMSYEVRNISWYMKGMTDSIHDLNVNVSYLLKEKRQIHDASMSPCEEITEHMVSTPATEQQSCVESVLSCQNEVEGSSPVSQTHAMGNESSPSMNLSEADKYSLSRLDAIEESYGLLSANKNIEGIKTEAENEEESASFHVYNTDVSCKKESTSEEEKDKTIVFNEDWFPSLENSLECRAMKTENNEEDIPDRNRLLERVVDSSATTSRIENFVYFDNQIEYYSAKDSERYRMEQTLTRDCFQNLNTLERQHTEAFKRAITVAPILGSETKRDGDKESGLKERGELLKIVENERVFTDIGEFAPSTQEEGVVERGERWRSNMFNISTWQGKLQHMRKGPFRCKTCGKCFSGYGHLENHQRIHTGEKPFECYLCNKSFAAKSNLVRHLRVHSCEKLLSCNVCEKAFKRKADFDKHMQLHSGEKPFKCQECGKAFGTSSELIKHKHIHRSERPYSCTDCEKRFTQLGNLATHRRLMHKAFSSFSQC